ncbi:phage shock protein C (PspC) family protein [Winogradskyella wandonensis]|uniref:Phage shock protein C (PspC) family protein n=1 Tax=Winogradskyella wandonensis TaxID=1442586 RepID=A0A4R1KRC0_9FLAO|nr:PspC domain-containing protein [Winogradskyella wandonensis]TCK66679.1 phage shock protein C (PspC) family protein [Winogradskyella wandonensis]
MNKTVNINLAGIFFHIDEDAYLKLSRYLEAITRSFTDSQGRSEIIADIEARIAELFSERIQNDKQVVGIKLVDEVITIMGQPEDYLVDDEIFEDEPTYAKQRQTKSGPTKKLYRDTDNSYIGGVAAGLSHYLGIDMLWVRLLWVIFALASGGSFIVIYIIFWALVPEATTTAEKLTMTGEPVNISNIEKKIKDGIDIVSEKVKNVDFKKHGDTIKEGFENVADNISETVKSVDFEKQGDRLKNKSRNFFETIGDIVMFFFKVFAKFFGVIMIITGISALIALLIALFTVGITDAINFPGIDFLVMTNATNTPIWLMSLFLFLAVGIPFFFLFYLGLKILVNNLKSIGNIAKFTLLGLWIIAILGLITIGVKQAAEYSYNAFDTKEVELNITANDTLKISMANNGISRKRLYINNGGFGAFIDKDGRKNITNDKVRFIVRSTKDSIAKLEISKNAYGSSYERAFNRAENIDYNYNFANNELVLDKYITTDTRYKYGDQGVQIIIYLPEGSTLYADDNTYRYHRNRRIYDDILDNGMEEHYLRVLDNQLKCLDCDEDTAEIETEEDNKTTLKINSEEGILIKSGDSIKLKIDSEGINANGSEVQVKIDEETGVEIKTKNNDN